MTIPLNRPILENGRLRPGLKFLIADDDAGLIRASVRCLVRGLPIKKEDVIEALNGRDAVTAFHQQKDSIVAVLSDVVMPHGSGVDVYREVRKYNPLIPIGFYSGGLFDFREEIMQILKQDPERTRLFKKPDDILSLADWFRSALQVYNDESP